MSIVKGRVADLSRPREQILRFLRGDAAANFFALKAVNGASAEFVFWWIPDTSFAFRSDATRPLTITGNLVPDELVTLIASFIAEELYSGRSSPIRADAAVVDAVQRICAELRPGCAFQITRRLQLMVQESPVQHVTPPGLLVRQATLNDLNDYIPLYQQFLEDVNLVNANNSDTIKQAERNISEQATFVLVSEDKLIGTASAITGEDGVAKISAVFISREFRGRGFGKYLISAVTEHVAIQGSKCMLYANCENSAAIKLYESCGFVNREDSVKAKLKWLPRKWHLKIDDNYYFSEISEADKAAIAARLNDVEVSHNMLAVSYPYTEADAQYFVSLVNDATTKQGRPWTWAIRENGELIGCVNLRVDGSSHKASIGYWLGKAYWGKGIMTKAVAVAVAYAFEEIAGLVRIEATVRDVNAGSAGVLLKNGFEEEGFSRKYAKKGEQYFDCKLFARVI